MLLNFFIVEDPCLKKAMPSYHPFPKSTHFHQQYQCHGKGSYGAGKRLRDKDLSYERPCKSKGHIEERARGGGDKVEKRRKKGESMIRN
jgi:hypothetical protein